MPFSIDFDHIVGPFRSIGGFLLKPIAQSFQRLGKWLQDRVKQADKLDEASRGYPAIAFYNESVTLWLDGIQRGALSPNGDPPGLRDQMARAGRAFVDGLKRIPEAIESNLILPRLLAVAGAAVGSIDQSMARFETPAAQMFDPRQRKASDLFGEAALAWRALNSSRRQILEALFLQFGPAYLLLKGGESEGGKQDPRSTTDLLDWLARYIVGGLLVLVALSEWWPQIWAPLLFAGKSALLSKLAAVEETIFAFRRSLIDKLYVKLRDSINTAQKFLEIASGVLLGQFSYWAGFMQDYVDAVLTELAWALFQLSDYLYQVLAWIIDIFISNEGSLLKLNKWMPAVLAGTFLAGDLASILDPLDISGIGARFDAAQAIEAILNAGPGPPHKGDLTKKVLPPFPNIVDAFTGVASAADASRKFKDIARTLPGQLSAIATAASTALNNAALGFDKQAAAAARMGSPADFSLVAKQAAANAASVFGPDAQALRDRIAQEPEDPMADTVAQWFAVGGFETLEKSLEGYISEMLHTFRKQEEAGEDTTVLITKTSPAILAKKAVLGRAVVQKITVNARGRKLDDRLVAEIAEGFRDKVVEAYRQGRQLILDQAAAVSL
jgi:hypothetical protein